MVKIGSKWVRKHHAEEVYVVRMIEGGQVYLAHTKMRGSTCSIPLGNIGLEFAPASIQLPTVTVTPELLPLALPPTGGSEEPLRGPSRPSVSAVDIQAARVQAEVDGSLRMRLKNVRTDSREMTERKVR